MKVQVHHDWGTSLPTDDIHPYRTGAWRPQHVEYDAWNLDVEGEIPHDLAGTYIRNTENPTLEPLRRYHPFDGDGMLHSITFDDGDARYANRFVPTDGFVAEHDAGRMLWAGIGENPALSVPDHGWGARGHMKDASSTDVVVHNGVALSSFWQCGDLYRFDPQTLEPMGKERFGGRFPADGVSAHTKIDEISGEMLFFNYSKNAPFMHYGEVSASGELTNYIPVELPGPRLPHDMAFTENYAIVNDCPMFWDPVALELGYHVTTFYPDLPTRFGVIPRGGASGEVQWFEADPTYVLHWINAWEDGREIVLDGFFQHNPSPARREGEGVSASLYRYLDLHTLDSRPHRWRFDLDTGRCREEELSDTVMEFGMINGLHGGRQYRYSYNALPCQGWFGFHGIVKHDLVSGTEEAWELPDGVYASETVMAPRIGSTAEDDGYLITFTTDVVNDRSQCVIFDAASPADGPIAAVSLPERISSGTHAFWAGAS